MLKLDLQFFADGEDDLDSMIAEFENEYVEDDNLDIEDELETETELEETEEVSTESTEVVDNVPSEDEKRNAAFAELRRQAESNKQYAGFVQKLAESAGITPEEVIQRFEERRLEEEAETQNVPVDVLKRLQSLEQENETVKAQMTAASFNTQVAETVKKFEASEDDVRATFTYAVERGLDLTNGTIPFEEVYRLAHMDSIIKKEVEQSKQTSLENKRKRQTNATLAIGDGESTNTDEITDDFLDAELERMGLSSRI